MSFRPLTKTAAPMTVIEQMLIPAVYTGTDDSTDSAQLDLGAAGTPVSITGIKYHPETASADGL